MATEPTVLVSWQPIETAPRDGTEMLVLSKADTIPDGSGGVVERPARCAIAQWNPDGDSWANDVGNTDPELGEVAELATNGTWSSGGGWFEPDEVTHWMPLPGPPALPPANSGTGGPTVPTEPPAAPAPAVTVTEATESLLLFAAEPLPINGIACVLAWAYARERERFAGMCREEGLVAVNEAARCREFRANMAEHACAAQAELCGRLAARALGETP